MSATSFAPTWGKRWREAVLLIGGRIGFDYFALLAALRATGAKPNAPLVLLAYAATAVIALFPITPGGARCRRGQSQRIARTRWRDQRPRNHCHPGLSTRDLLVADLRGWRDLYRLSSTIRARKIWRCGSLNVLSALRSEIPRRHCRRLGNPSSTTASRGVATTHPRTTPRADVRRTYAQ